LEGGDIPCYRKVWGIINLKHVYYYNTDTAPQNVFQINNSCKITQLIRILIFELGTPLVPDQYQWGVNKGHFVFIVSSKVSKSFIKSKIARKVFFSGTLGGCHPHLGTGTRKLKPLLYSSLGQIIQWRKSHPELLRIKKVGLPIWKIKLFAQKVAFLNICNLFF
jgi:hypothetical protein